MGKTTGLAVCAAASAIKFYIKGSIHDVNSDCRDFNFCIVGNGS